MVMNFFMQTIGAAVRNKCEKLSTWFYTLFDDSLKLLFIGATVIICEHKFMMIALAQIAKNECLAGFPHYAFILEQRRVKINSLQI